MRKFGKKIASVLLVAALLLTNATTVFAADADNGDSSVIEPSSEVIIPDEEPGTDVGEEPSLDDPAEEEEQPTLPEDEEPVDSLPPAEEQAPLEEVVPDEKNGPDFVDEDYYLTNAGELTKEQLADKVALKEIYKGLEDLQPDTDYVPNQAVFLSDSKEEAEVIATAYGAVLEQYSDGVAVISFTYGVPEVILVAADVEISVPAVYPNLLYTLETSAEVVDTDKITDNVAAAAPVNDEEYGEQGFHGMIGDAAAWERGAKGDGVLVAVIDSGINTKHEDLKSNIQSAVTKSTGGYNGAVDNNGHGSHVSGIIAAAANNGVGGAGVAPNAKIMSIKALEQIRTGTASGSTADIVMAVNYAAANKNTRIINMSLGGGGVGAHPDPIYQSAISAAADKGIIVVVAAGNESKDLDGDYRAYPACFDDVVTVAALDEAGTGLADYSNFGSNFVDIIAPGTQVFSSYGGNSDSYAKLDGTSMATPVVSGILALILSSNPDFKTRSKATADLAVELLYQYAGAPVAGYKFARASEPVTNIPKEVAKPVFTFALDTDNKIIADETTIELTTTTAGSTIYYTLDGKNPTENSTKYTGPFALSATGSKTIKAVAINHGRKSLIATQKVSLKAKITAIAITAANNATAIMADKTLKFTAAYTPAYATTKKVTWEIHPDDVAVGKISSKGILSAVNKNMETTADVRVRAVANDKGFSTAASAYTTIRLYPKTTKQVFTMGEISSKNALDYVASGKSLQLMVDVNGGSGAKLIEWVSADEKIAKVNASGKVTAISRITEKKTVKITARAKTDPLPASTKEFTVTVYPATTKLTTNTPKVTLAVNPSGAILSTATFAVATITPSAAANSVEPYKFTSSKESVATVGADGLITAKAPGKATIKAIATDGTGKSISCAVTVVTPATGVYISNSTNKREFGEYVGSDFYVPVAVKKSIQLKASVLPLNATNKKVTWSTNNSSIATVSSSGKVTGKSTGTVKITAEAKDGSGFKEDYLIKVYTAPKAMRAWCYMAPPDAPKAGMFYPRSSYTYKLDRGYFYPTGDAYELLGVDFTVNSRSKVIDYSCFGYFEMTSSNPAVAKVDFDSTYGWIVRALKNGKATLTFKAVDGSGRKATLKVAVIG